MPEVFKVAPVYQTSGKFHGIKINNKVMIKSIESFIPDCNYSTVVSDAVNDGCPFSLMRKYLDKQQVEMFASHDFEFPPSYSISELIDQCGSSGPISIDLFRNSVVGGRSLGYRDHYKNYINFSGVFGCSSSEKFKKNLLKFKTACHADSFEWYRQSCFSDNLLDLSYTWSVSSYSMECFMFESKNSIQYVKDSKMKNLVERLIRPGISNRKNQWSEALKLQSKGALH